jgi:acyl-CoA oxidase
LESVRVAELHCAAFLFADNARKFSNVTTSGNVGGIMRKMTELYGLHVLRTFGDQGYLEGYLTPQHLKDVERLYCEVSLFLFYDI